MWKFDFQNKSKFLNIFRAFDVLSRSLLTEMLEISENWNHSRYFDTKIEKSTVLFLKLYSSMKSVIQNKTIM